VGVELLSPSHKVQLIFSGYAGMKLFSIYIILFAETGIAPWSSG